MSAGVLPSFLGVVGLVLVTIGVSIVVADTPLMFTGAELVVFGAVALALAGLLYHAR